jgi:hypothetical protein
LYSLVLVSATGVIIIKLELCLVVTTNLTLLQSNKMFLPCRRWIGIAALLVVSSNGFVPHPQRASLVSKSSSSQSRRYVINDLQRPPTFLDDGDDSSQKQQELDEPRQKLNNRWQSLNPKLKERLIERGQAKAISNKQKREPASDKKRRKLCSL